MESYEELKPYLDHIFKEKALSHTHAIVNLNFQFDWDFRPEPIRTIQPTDTNIRFFALLCDEKEIISKNQRWRAELLLTNDSSRKRYVFFENIKKIYPDLSTKKDKFLTHPPLHVMITSYIEEVVNDKKNAKKNKNNRKMLNITFKNMLDSAFQSRQLVDGLNRTHMHFLRRGETYQLENLKDLMKLPPDLVKQNPNTAFLAALILKNRDREQNINSLFFYVNSEEMFDVLFDATENTLLEPKTLIKNEKDLLCTIEREKESQVTVLHKAASLGKERLNKLHKRLLLAYSSKDSNIDENCDTENFQSNCSMINPLFYIKLNSSEDESVEIAGFFVNIFPEVNSVIEDKSLEKHLQTPAEKYAKINPPKTMMERSAAFNNIKMIDFLATKKNDLGKALFYCNSPECVDSLLKNGADIHLKIDGETAFQSHMKLGNVSVAKRLLEKGANLNDKNSNGESVLRSIAQSEFHNLASYQEAIELLLEYKFDLNEKDEFGRTALFYATNKELINILRGQNIEETPDTSGRTPLHVLAGRKLSPSNKHLTKSDVEFFDCFKDFVNSKDSNGCTPLFHATSFPAFKKLLELGANPWLLDEKDNTIIHVLAQDWQWSLKFRELTSKFPTLFDTLRNKENKEGKTPFSICEFKVFRNKLDPDMIASKQQR